MVLEKHEGGGIAPPPPPRKIGLKEVHGLSGEFYGPQRFIEQGIKNNSFKCFWHKSSRYPKLRSHVTKIFMAKKSTEAHRILTFMEKRMRRVNAL